MPRRLRTRRPPKRMSATSPNMTMVRTRVNPRRSRRAAPQRQTRTRPSTSRTTTPRSTSDRLTEPLMDDRDGMRDHGPNWSRINQWVLWLGLAAAVAWLFYRHNEHILSLAPFLFVLACPLMHLFGHRHGGHESDGDSSLREGSDRNDKSAPGHSH